LIFGAIAKMIIKSRIYNSKRITETIGGKTYTYRSGFERDWAKYLQFLKNYKEIYDWEYEPKPPFDFFSFGYRNKPYSYLPDFKVWTKSKIFHYEETKGELTTKDLSKYTRLARHYPDVIIDIILQRIPTKGKMYSAYAKLQTKQGGAIRRIIDGSYILKKQLKGII
jgi:hypothetical protein